MLDSELSSDRTLQVDDLKYLLDRASRETTAENRLIINQLQIKIFDWLQATHVDKKSGGRKDVQEPHNPKLKAEINTIIGSLKNGEHKFDPMAMAILSYYLDACIKKHEIEGSSQIGLFSEDIKQLLVDESGKKFKEGLSEKSHENDTDTLHAPESTGELSTSSNLRDAALLSDDRLMALTELTAAEDANDTNTLHSPESTGELSTSVILKDAVPRYDNPEEALTDLAPAAVFSPKPPKSKR